MCRSVCFYVLGEDVQFLGEEEVVVTGFILVLPEDERVGNDFQLREAGSLSLRRICPPGAATLGTRKFPSLATQGIN